MARKCRELENRVKRAVVMAEEPLLSLTDLGLPTSAGEPQSLLISAARARAEREALQLALAQAGSQQSFWGSAGRRSTP